MKQLKQQNTIETVIREERIHEGIKYTYELMRCVGERTHNWRLPLYSIRIAMVDVDGRESHGEARDLFRDKKSATRFFNRLVKELCTPIDLRYVVEDELI